jgi:hypothetical protein
MPAERNYHQCKCNSPTSGVIASPKVCSVNKISIFLCFVYLHNHTHICTVLYLTYYTHINLAKYFSVMLVCECVCKISKNPVIWMYLICQRYISNTTGLMDLLKTVYSARVYVPLPYLRCLLVHSLNIKDSFSYFPYIFVGQDIPGSLWDTAHIILDHNDTNSSICTMYLKQSH